MFTINLGPFSGKNAPEIHYHPSIAEGYWKAQQLSACFLASE